MEEQTATPAPSKQTKLIAGLVVVFGLFHCASLLVALLPADSKLNQLLEPYRKLTGTQQQWDMFATIPIAQEREVIVEVVDAAGNRSNVGPILPGLSEFDMEKRIRYYPLLHRLMARDGIYLGSYLGKLEAELVSIAGDGAREFSLKSETEYIRLLKRVEEDGEMTVRKQDVIGPVQIGK